MKKTLLSFLTIGATCVTLAQTKPATDPGRTATPSPTTTNSTLNNNTNNTNAPINGTNPVNSGTGTVNGHNTMMNENRNYPGNNSMNNTPANSTLNSSTQPANSNMNGTTNPNGNTTMDNGNMTTSGTLSTTTNSAAYNVSVPSSVQTSFTTAYPAAGTTTWSQSGDWYRARYRENGRLIEASYREDGKSFTRTASPMLRTYVPEEVVNKALDMYGVNVYAIAMTKNADGQNMYNVTIIDNGESRTEWMNEDGTAVTSPYRTEEAAANATMENNNATQQAPEAETIPAEQALDNSEPVDNSNMQNDMIDETGEQQLIDQGTEQQQLEPDNQMNTEGIMNGRTSEETLKDQTTDDTLEDETPMYQPLDGVEVSPESSDNSPVIE